jgi:preprotein translocase subunit SecA
MRQIERFAMLSSIDNLWMDHIDAMDDLREGIWLRGDKQTVLSEYKREGFEMFETLIASIDSEVAKRVFRVQVAQTPQPTVPAEVMEAKKEAVDVLPEEKQEKRRQTSGDFASALAGTANKSSKPDRRVVLQKVKSGEKKVGRNDPCPCGAINPNTGKPYKYKKCGLIGAPHHKG